MIPFKVFIAEIWDMYKLIITIALIYITICMMSELPLVHVNVSNEMETMLNNLTSIFISSLSSLFGIIISIFILAFTLFEKNYNEMAYTIFINSTELKRYFQLFISTILVTLSAVYLNQNISILGLYISVYSTVLYIMSIIMIYPTIKSLITESKSNKHLDNIIKKINDQSAQQYVYFNEIEILKNNPFYKLSIISRPLIKSGENIVLNKVLQSCLMLMKIKIDEAVNKEANYCRDFIYAFVRLFTVMNSHVNNQNEKWIIYQFVKIYIELRKYNIEKKIPTFDFIEFERFIQNLFIKSERIIDNELTIKYIYFLFNFIQGNIDKNLPKEEELFIFQSNENMKDSYDHNKIAQWDYICTDISSNINEIANFAISNSQTELYYPIINGYNSLFSKIIKNEKLSNKQKKMLILINTENLFNIIESIINKESDYNFISTFEYFAIKESYNQSEELFTILFNGFIRLFPLLAKGKKLNTYIISKYGALGRSVVSYLDGGKTIKLALKKLVEILVLTAIYIIKLNPELKTLNTYKEIHREVKSIIDWVKKSKIESNNLSKELEGYLFKMDKIEEVNKILSDDNLYLESLFKE